MNQDFVDNIVAMYGDAGRKILDNIPEVIKKYESEWSIKVEQPYKLSYNYVAPAKTSNEESVVFKIGLHGDREFLPEYESLKAFEGDGIPRLLKVELDDRVMLLEKVEPGIPLSNLADDDEATRIIAGLIKKLHKPIPNNSHFLRLQDWAEAFGRLRTKFNGTTGPLPEDLIQKGEELFKHLINTSGEAFLLHGDLHHENILSSNRQGWLAIDPDPVIGELAHETAAALRNPLEKLEPIANLTPLLSKRISIFSEELNIDKDRIRLWGAAQSIMSAIWKAEDNRKGWDSQLRIAETLFDME